MLAEIAKAGGKQLECSSSRGVIVSDSAGKQMHSWVRGRLAEPAANVQRQTQFGASSHAGTDFCSHLARAYWSYVWRGGCSGYQLFVDVVGAFDAVVRRYISDESTDDERVIHVLRAMGQPPESVHELVRYIQQGGPNLVAEAGASKHLCAILAEMHANTWHTTQGLEEVTACLLGSKAGDPLGGIVFDFIAARVLKDIEQKLRDEGLIFKVPPVVGWRCAVEERDVLDATFADDSVYFGPAVPADQVLGAARATLVVVAAVYAKYQLQVNTKVGKRRSSCLCAALAPKQSLPKLQQTIHPC